MFRRKKKSILLGLHDQDMIHHIILALILFGGFAGIVYATDENTTQFTIGFITALLYVGWGVFHHYHDGDLHVKNILEYVLIASLGILVLAVVFL